NMTFSDKELDELAQIFRVEEGHLGVKVHPGEPSQLVVAARYPYKPNAAAAVSSYLNRDFYEDVPQEIAAKIQYIPNSFSFIERQDSGRTVYATFCPSKSHAFATKLVHHAGPIHYVVGHPDILFLRPQLDFKAARAHIEAGFRVSLQPV